MKIFRYELDVTDHQILQLPLSSRPLSVAPGRDGDYHIDMWCQVPELAPDVPYHFYVIGTGNKMPHEAARRFLGTVVMSDGHVWHVYTSEEPR